MTSDLPHRERAAAPPARAALHYGMTTLDAADVPAVLRLLELAGLPTVGVSENPGAFVVLRSDRQIVACCGLEHHGSDGLLRSVAVRASHQGKGLATALVQQVLSLPVHASLANIYLLTTTARDFFPRFGFAVCSRDQAPPAIRGSWEFRTGCPQTATLMVRASAGRVEAAGAPT